VIAADHQLFAETLDLVLDLQPDAVLMDLEMPVLDGFHATRLLRRLLPACPVIVLTASPSSEDLHRARSAGVAALFGAGPCVLSPAADTEREAGPPHQVTQP
jgi:CheY-like chemotaxis protein